MKKAVCALIFHPTEDTILMVSRKNDHTKFGLPGGKVEEGETIIAALLRETLEETGLAVVRAHEVFTMVDEEGWETTTYWVSQFEGNVSTKENIVIKWGDWEDLFDGPFGVYNKFLYSTFNNIED